MKIDWFTVIAQIINFLILVALLKRFLYKPILQAIEVREKRIKDELQDVAEKEAVAEKERSDFQQKNLAFEQEKTELMAKMTEEIKAERLKRLNELRLEAKVLEQHLQENSKTEQQKLASELSGKIQEEVLATARKILADLTSESLEDHLSEVFIKHLNKLDPKEKEVIRTACKTSSDTPLIRSAFELSPTRKTAIEAAIKDLVTSPVTVKFETGVELIFGIELILNNYTITWSLDEYISSFKNAIVQGYHTDREIIKEHGS